MLQIDTASNFYYTADNMKVKDVIRKDLVTTTLDAPFREIWKIIFQKHFNAIPVVDKKHSLVGIVTKEDILQKLYPDLQEFVENLESLADFEDMEKKIMDLSGLKAKDVMSRSVIFTRLDTPVMRALSRMIVRSVNQLPVLDHNDLVIGMVTKGDVFYALFRYHLKEKIPGSLGLLPSLKYIKKEKRKSSRRG